MDYKTARERQKKIIEEYHKGTKTRVIMAYFAITRGGIYHILKTRGIKTNRTPLDKKE